VQGFSIRDRIGRASPLHHDIGAIPRGAGPCPAGFGSFTDDRRLCGPGKALREFAAPAGFMRRFPCGMCAGWMEAGGRTRLARQQKMPICRDFTGATGLEPATSGVTGRRSVPTTEPGDERLKGISEWAVALSSADVSLHRVRRSIRCLFGHELSPRLSPQRG
jgi:hypothetical protein